MVIQRPVQLSFYMYSIQFPNVKHWKRLVQITKSVFTVVRRQKQYVYAALSLVLFRLLLPKYLRTSSIRITGAETMMTRNHSFALNGTTQNTSARNGTYSMRQCRPNEIDMAMRSHAFLQGGMVTKLLSSERAFRELNISIATSTESDNVIAFTLPLPKYSQGFEKVIRRLPAMNGVALKFDHDEHSPQLRSCDNSTRVCPSLTRLIPMKDACVYHNIKIPTVAIPTYVPITCHFDHKIIPS